MCLFLVHVDGPWRTLAHVAQQRSRAHRSRDGPSTSELAGRAKPRVQRLKRRPSPRCWSRSKIGGVASTSGDCSSSRASIDRPVTRWRGCARSPRRSPAPRDSRRCPPYRKRTGGIGLGARCARTSGRPRPAIVDVNGEPAMSELSAPECTAPALRKTRARGAEPSSRHSPGCGARAAEQRVAKP